MTRHTPPPVAGLILSPAERARALTAALLDGPDLTGAACTGRAPLFDERAGREAPDAYAARLTAAQAVCRTCPVLDRCRDAAAGIDDTLRAGVWAGTPWEHRDTRRAREAAEKHRAAHGSAASGSPADEPP